MDVSKVLGAVDNAKTAITLARTELNNAITAERKVLADPKADVAALSGASRALQVAGRIDTTLTNATKRLTGSADRITKSLKKLEPKAKKAKKAKGDGDSKKK